MNNVIRRLAAATTAFIVICSIGSTPRAAAVAPIDKRITYLLPQWFAFLSSNDAEVAQQVAVMRSRIGEGSRVKLGFTTYISLNMSDVDPTDTVAVRAALAPTTAQMDLAITLARNAGIPICLSFLTQTRVQVDAAEAATQLIDRRSMQWYSDNAMATGWSSLSRYNRRYRAVREAFVREIGGQLSERMLLYPETVVAASGDGEVELSFDKSAAGPDAASYTPETSLFADYSPFAIAEFRDWLRRGGLYAPGQAFAGEAYALSARYAGDLAPNVDTNGDGHTLNGDFGVTFTDWSLKHFDWSLSDNATTDPLAIPAGTYNLPGFNATPSQFPAGFDAPRARNLTDAYWAVWSLFRQTMVYRNNQTFAKWITTSPGPSGATVPGDRWFSDQVAADYLFTTVSIPGVDLVQPPGFRYEISGSTTWGADTSPYGSLGITSFNVNVGIVPPYGQVYYKTLTGAAPEIAKRNVRWGIFEWNPSIPKAPDVKVYDDEMALVEKYRPSVLAPFSWAASFDGAEILDTPFETALKNWVIRRHNIPLTLNKTKLYASTFVDGSARSAPQEVRVTGEPGETPAWNASSSSAFIDIVKAADGRSFTVALTQQAYAAGTQSATVVVTPTAGTGYAASTLTFEFTASTAAATKAPVGSFDTPADMQVVTGEVGFTGWAIDDVGVKSVDIFRAPLPGEPTQPNGLVFLGSASPVEGARPDIEATYGTIPANTQAGWGYMLLSNFLPLAGNGIFTITVSVTDLDGHTVVLGTRRIDCRNSSNAKPFGTIDTPRQGETVTGTIVNFGWTLTPLPNTIAFDGSGIDVVIDNVVVGRPTYNQYRADIAALFPGLNNTGAPGAGGAIGYFYIDTTTLTNGLHTIAWIVRDSGGGATGMGSRYFTVANP